MSTTTSIILDTRRMKKSDKYPVKLRVIFNRVTEYYQTIFDLSKEEWDKLPASRISNELQTVRDKLKEIQRESEAVIKDLEPFSFSEFEKIFIQSHQHFRQRKNKVELVIQNSNGFDYSLFHKKFPLLLKNDSKPGIISFSYQIYIKKLLRDGRISSAISYHCSYVSLNKFKGDVPFTDITPSYLTEYENRLKSQQISRTTIGMKPLKMVLSREKNAILLVNANTGYHLLKM
jgi:integrase/recombinase XerD